VSPFPPWEKTTCLEREDVQQKKNPFGYSVAHAKGLSWGVNRGQTWGKKKSLLGHPLSLRKNWERNLTLKNGGGSPFVRLLRKNFDNRRGQGKKPPGLKKGRGEGGEGGRSLRGGGEGGGKTSPWVILRVVRGFTCGTEKGKKRNGKKKGGGEREGKSLFCTYEGAESQSR